VKVLSIAFLALTVLGAAVVYATSGAAREDGCSLASFDTRAWAAESSSDRQPSGGPSARQRLADHLIACESLHGARRAQVRKVLGRPDNYVAQDTRLYEDGTWSWDLGTQRDGFPVDDEHLVLRFGREGRVRSAELATD
jgi:hypothetical protein